ncbi:hypothetical protein scyTo_0024026 [Scyliorhinus torazame]|uniref:Ig-like domain-containing protein n=1 Tax=Scyliorhinus torazame TaxID=75743 RepID=A0A401QC14_SCYTO|nr:hypothetical protein [Scyliorhinus torazame]
MEPALYVLSPTFEEIDMTAKATLVCLAAGFYPKDISFRWFVDGSPVVDDVTSYPPVLNINGTYSAQSDLTSTAQKWNHGSVYSCEIQHVSVPDGIVQTINKTLGKKTRFGIATTFMDKESIMEPCCDRVEKMDYAPNPAVKVVSS